MQLRLPVVVVDILTRMQWRGAVEARNVNFDVNVEDSADSEEVVGNSNCFLVDNLCQLDVMVFGIYLEGMIQEEETNLLENWAWFDLPLKARIHSDRKNFGFIL